VNKAHQSHGTGQKGVGKSQYQGGRYAAGATRRVEDQCDGKGEIARANDHRAIPILQSRA